MITPAVLVSQTFVSDGTSTSFALDLTLPPVKLAFEGNPPLSITKVSVTSSQGSVTPLTAELAGTTVTLTFAAPLPVLDPASATLIYTLAFYLVFTN